MFKYDSKFMNFLSKCADYICLCILGLVFSIPIVTIGAATSAKYYVAMKLARGEDAYIFKDFVKAFKSNFKIATKAWIILLILDVIFAYNWFLIYANREAGFKQVYVYIFLAVSAYIVLLQLMIFPFIARFENTLLNTFKLTMCFTLIRLIRLVIVLFLDVLPFLLSYKMFNMSMGIIPVGSALALYLNSFIFANTFKKIEPEKKSEEVEAGDDETESAEMKECEEDCPETEKEDNAAEAIESEAAKSETDENK